MQKRSPRRDTYFTLIELLVVVAIISILASMLLPALTAARERARMAVCMGNMKQIAMATNLYLSDSQEIYMRQGYNSYGSLGHFGVSYKGLGFDRQDIWTWYSDYMLGDLGDITTTGSGNLRASGIENTPSKAFECPSNVRTGTYWYSSYQYLTGSANNFAMTLAVHAHFSSYSKFVPDGNRLPK